MTYFSIQAADILRDPKAKPSIRRIIKRRIAKRRRQQEQKTIASYRFAFITYAMRDQ